MCANDLYEVGTGFREVHFVAGEDVPVLRRVRRDRKDNMSIMHSLKLFLKSTGSKILRQRACMGISAAWCVHDILTWIDIGTQSFRSDSCGSGQSSCDLI